MKHPFDFLTSIIVAPTGEFRINTNKNGIRLFVQFSLEGWTGYHLEYLVRNSPDGDACIHPNDLLQVVSVYKESFQGSTLFDCTTKLMNSLPYTSITRMDTPISSFSVVDHLKLADFQKWELRYTIQSHSSKPA